MSVLKIFGNNTIYLFNRNRNKLKKFAKKIRNKNLIIIDGLKELKDLTNIDLVINATTVGFDCWFKRKKIFIILNTFHHCLVLKN